MNGFKEHRLHNNFGPDDIHFHFSNVIAHSPGDIRSLHVTDWLDTVEHFDRSAVLQIGLAPL